MGKLAYDDKLRMQTLREQGSVRKPSFPVTLIKGLNLSTVKKVCSRVELDRTGSAVLRKPGSGRPASATNSGYMSVFPFSVYIVSL